MKVLLFFLLTLLIPLQANCSDSNNLNSSISKVEGFRGIEWGTDIKTLKDMSFGLEIKLPYGIIKYYSLKNDKLKIGDAKVLSIDYVFWHDKLFQISIGVDIINMSALQEVLFAKYGNPRKEWLGCSEYSWISGKTKITKHCPNTDKFETDTSITLSSVEILKQQDATMKKEEALKKQRYNEQENKIKRKAKEAAKSDL